MLIYIKLHEDLSRFGCEEADVPKGEPIHGTPGLELSDEVVKASVTKHNRLTVEDVCVIFNIPTQELSDMAKGLPGRSGIDLLRAKLNDESSVINSEGIK